MSSPQPNQDGTVAYWGSNGKWWDTAKDYVINPKNIKPKRYHLVCIQEIISKS